MVRKKVISVSIVICICWIIPLILLVKGKDQYMFPNYVNLGFRFWLITYFFISLVGVTILLIIKCFTRPKLVIFSILLIVSLIPQYFINAFLLWGVYGGSWQSSTNNVSDFGKIDQYFDYHFEISELKLSDIRNDCKKATQYNYFYHSGFGGIDFDISFEMELSNNDYDELKEIFQQTMETKIQEDISQTDLKSGRFIVSEDTPTTVDEWDEMYIEYNDLTCTFYMKFKGVCYT